MNYVQKIKAKGKIFYGTKYNRNSENKIDIFDFIFYVFINQGVTLLLGYFFSEWLLYLIAGMLFVDFLLWYNLTAINLIGYDTDND